MPHGRRASALHAPPGAPIAGPFDARSLLGHSMLDDAFLRDPYPTYRALRDAAPLVWSDEFFGGAWLVSRHADVELVLRDARFSAQRTGGWVMRPVDEAEIRSYYAAHPNRVMAGCMPARFAPCTASRHALSVPTH